MPEPVDLRTGMQFRGNAFKPFIIATGRPENRKSDNGDRRYC
jgi:hypothetical protein